jgi:DNA-3-methyladenine glycosylase I
MPAFVAGAPVAEASALDAARPRRTMKKVTPPRERAGARGESAAADDGGRRSARCWWAGDDPIYIDYHDREWGFPVRDDRRLFEKICLEGFQAGLSWRTILYKRDAFRDAFANFEFARVARFTQRDVERLVADAAIVRHRGKIESARNNAKRALEIVDEFGSLAAYFWRFEPAASTRPEMLTRDVLAGMPTSAESTALSKDLKRRGWTFVGPTTVYAFMQAMGLVNDHVHDCATRAPAQQARDLFERPRAKGRRRSGL